jgi:DNA-binding LacI/PurR family transcriptional regulator
MLGEPTIYDIAKRAGVGIATVSRVLNSSNRVSEPTRLSVRQAMADLGFRPNRAARRLAVRGPNRPRVAALMPFFSANFYLAVSQPLSRGLALADVDMVLYNIQTREDKNRTLDRIGSERSCEGLILCSMGIGPERLDRFNRLGLPVVSIDYPLPDVPSVTVDNVQGGAKAARHLTRCGCRRLGLVSGPAVALAFRNREVGFTEVAGSEAPQMRAETLTLAGGRAAVAALLDHYPDLDGIVCVNDLLAVGALEELRERGHKVPTEVQVIGFDDQPLMDVIGLTTVRQPMAEFGAWAAAAMCTLLERPAAKPPPSLQLPLTLVPRSTTRAPTGSTRPGHPHRKEKS